MSNLNLQILERVPIPIPSIAEQQEIIRRVEALFTFADRIESRVTTVRRQLDPLGPSLIAKAFRGELVPTEAELARREGRDYESAAALLERIRRERAANPTGTVSTNAKPPVSTKRGSRVRTCRQPIDPRRAAG